MKNFITKSDCSSHSSCSVTPGRREHRPVRLWSLVRCRRLRWRFQRRHQTLTPPVYVPFPSTVQGGGKRRGHYRLARRYYHRDDPKYWHFDNVRRAMRTGKVGVRAGYKTEQGPHLRPTAKQTGDQDR
jgi:hypothetical protein